MQDCISSTLTTYDLQYKSQKSGLLIENTKQHTLNHLVVTDVNRALKENGALIFRGFGANADSFTKFSNRFSDQFSYYEGGGLQWRSLNRERVNNNDTMFTTTGGNIGFHIPLHAEMHYTGRPPKFLWFFCEEAPRDRGETLLADSRVMFSTLSQETQTFFRANRIKYIRDYKNGEWQRSFNTKDILHLKTLCAEQACTLITDTEQNVRIEYVQSAILKDEQQQSCFVNNVLVIHYFEHALESGLAQAYMPDMKKQPSPVKARMENGERFPEKILLELAEAAQKASVPHQWHAGDIILIDNFQTLHGRNESTDKERKIYVRMGY